jgi:hypothetical protein
MSITYTWKVTSLKVKDLSEDKKNAIVQTYWQKIGTDENGNEGTFSGATPFTVDPTDDSGPFVPFEQLTEEDVLDWIKSVVVGSYEEHVNSKIFEQIQDKLTPAVDAKLPWAPEEPVGNNPVVDPVANT